MKERLDLGENLKGLKKLVRRFGIIIAFIVLCIVTSFLSDIFLTTGNLINVLRQVSINGILAVGMTLVIISKGIDLSVGSILAITGAITATFLAKGFFIGIGLAIGLGMFLGFINGLAITRFNIPPFVATLGMMTVGRGMTLAYTSGYPLMPTRNPIFQAIGAGYIGPIPIPVIISAVVFVLLDFS